MKTEKETIREILVNWGVIKDGVFSKAQFDKNVNADWLRKKVLAYGFDKETCDTDEPLKLVPENVCSKCGKNPCECEAKPAPVEAPVVENVEAPAVEEAPAEVVETVETPVEEAPADETPADETPAKKKAAKKK